MTTIGRRKKKELQIATCYFCLRKFTVKQLYHEFEVCPECRQLQKEKKLIQCGNVTRGLTCGHEMHPTITVCIQCGYNRITGKIGEIKFS